MSAKLCKDCAFSFYDEWGLKCGNSKIPPKDLATGERNYADIVRRYDDCGLEGKLFEQRPPKISWWSRLQWRLWRWVRG